MKPHLTLPPSCLFSSGLYLRLVVLTLMEPSPSELSVLTDSVIDVTVSQALMSL